MDQITDQTYYSRYNQYHKSDVEEASKCDRYDQEWEQDYADYELDQSPCQPQADLNDVEDQSY